MEPQIESKSIKIGREELFGGTWRTLEGQIGGPSALEVQVGGTNWRPRALEAHLQSALGGPLEHLEGTSRADWGHLEGTWRTLGVHLELFGVNVE